MAEQDRRSRELEEMAERDRRLVGEARHDAALERPVAQGRPDHPHPDIAAADELRARDDVRTYDAQARAAEGQARTAEALEASGEQLEENRDAIEDLRRTARERSHDARALTGDLDALHRQTDQLRDAARDIQPPDVER